MKLWIEIQNLTYLMKLFTVSDESEFELKGMTIIPSCLNFQDLLIAILNKEKDRNKEIYTIHGIVTGEDCNHINQSDLKEARNLMEIT